MNFKAKEYLIAIVISCLGTTSVSAQDDPIKLSVADLFDLVVKNNPTLIVSKAKIDVASQEIEVAKNNLLPSVNTSMNAMYIGDAHLIERDFSDATRVEMPHFGNIFSVEATQLIWKGNAVRNSIKAKTLQEELASLDYLATEQNVKLLVLGYYLDLYKLSNQANVYRKNIDLAKDRLQNINRYFEQGMVTRNDVIRGELQISNLNLALQVVENNAQIMNNQLVVALGLPENTQVIPDEAVLDEAHQVYPVENYVQHIGNHPSVLMTQKGIDLYKLSEKITKAERMPTLVAFAGNNMQKPITNSLPAIDKYVNSWQVGLSLSFDIGSLYKTPKKIRQNQLEIVQANAQANEVEQMIGIAVNSAYIKYNEALTQAKTLSVNKELADENYRIMDKKYQNQLAILLDLIDASNAKLDAELQYTNAEINVIYNYYKLLKESGNL